MGWNIEFLSGGYGSFTTPEIQNIADNIYDITGKPVWLNIGITSELEAYGKEIAGVTGAVEVANPELHNKICPSKSLDDIGHMDFYLEEQMKRLQTDQIDFYLLHSLKKDYWKNLSSLGVLEFLDDAVADGRIKYAGFSFHDEIDLFFEIIDSYKWDVCQVQYNLVDENYQAGIDGIRYAASQGIGVMVMEPMILSFL